MKKRILSLFLALTLCLTLLPTSAFAEGGDVSISGGVIGGGETGGESGGVLVPPGGSTGEGGGIYVAPGSSTEGGGGTYIPGEDTRTEIRCVSKPDSIGRSGHRAVMMCLSIAAGYSFNFQAETSQRYRHPLRLLPLRHRGHAGDAGIHRRHRAAPARHGQSGGAEDRS